MNHAGDHNSFFLLPMYVWHYNYEMGAYWKNIQYVPEALFFFILDVRGYVWIQHNNRVVTTVGYHYIYFPLPPSKECLFDFYRK